MQKVVVYEHSLLRCLLKSRHWYEMIIRSIKAQYKFFYFDRAMEVEMNFKIISTGILAGLALLFIIQNFAVIDIRFLFWTLSISRSLLMFSLFLIGLILGWSLHSYSIYSRKKRE